MVMIDDATGRIVARFFEEETQAAAFEMLHRYAQSVGLSQALYVDRAGIYRSDRGSTRSSRSRRRGSIPGEREWGRSGRPRPVKMKRAPGDISRWSEPGDISNGA
jgi:hypothetical protein